MNLAAALEDDMIRVIGPELNGGASESASTSTIEVAEPKQGTELYRVTRAVGTFSFVLQPT